MTREEKEEKEEKRFVTEEEEALSRFISEIQKDKITRHSILIRVMNETNEDAARDWKFIKRLFVTYEIKNTDKSKAWELIKDTLIEDANKYVNGDMPLHLSLRFIKKFKPKDVAQHWKLLNEISIPVIINNLFCPATAEHLRFIQDNSLPMMIRNTDSEDVAKKLIFIKNRLFPIIVKNLDPGASILCLQIIKIFYISEILEIYTQKRIQNPHYKAIIEAVELIGDSVIPLLIKNINYEEDDNRLWIVIDEYKGWGVITVIDEDKAWGVITKNYLKNKYLDPLNLEFLKKVTFSSVSHHWKIVQTMSIPVLINKNIDSEAVTEQLIFIKDTSIPIMIQNTKCNYVIKILIFIRKILLPIIIRNIDHRAVILSWELIAEPYIQKIIDKTSCQAVIVALKEIKDIFIPIIIYNISCNYVNEDVNENEDEDEDDKE